jgi:hypothetical protein
MGRHSGHPSLKRTYSSPRKSPSPVVASNALPAIFPIPRYQLPPSQAILCGLRSPRAMSFGFPGSSEICPHGR